MNNLIDIFRRMGAGIEASHQGEYLHGWLPAMAHRPNAPQDRVNPYDDSVSQPVRFDLECESGAY